MSAINLENWKWLNESSKVGIEAQSPAGEGGDRLFSELCLEKKTVSNLRSGV